MTRRDPEQLTLDDLADLARERAGRGRRFVLGITGAPGAGKTTVADALADRLGPDLAVVLGQDGFHLANRVLVDLGRQDRKGAPDTFDVPGYAALLAAVAGQHALPPVDGQVPVIHGPVFRREIEEPIGSAVPVHPDVPLVITEGNYLLLEQGGWSQVRAHLDEVWFLSPDPDVRMARLVNRHRRFGRGHDEAAAWAAGPDQANADLVDATAVRADRVITLVERPASADPSRR